VPYSAAADRYQLTPYAKVGTSGLVLPKVSLGLWNNFGDVDPIDTQRAILRRAFDLGVTHFDLANNYGPRPGAAEENFGRFLAEDFRPYRDELIVSTKAGYPMANADGDLGPYQDGGSRKYLLSSLDQSLKRLGLDYVDIFYSHRYDPDVPLEETMGALATAVHSGKALYVGVSSYSPEDTVRAATILAEHRIPLTIHQPRYNLLDRRIEFGLLPALDEIGAGAIVFSPLAQGLLTNRYLDGIPTGSRASEGVWLGGQNITEDYLRRARALNEIAADRGQSLAQLAITWVLRHPQVASALVGASSVAQFEDVHEAANAAPLSADELAAIEPFAEHGADTMAPLWK
jgi:L-glyceraldehyde 3-phosphate reductase